MAKASGTTARRRRALAAVTLMSAACATDVSRQVAIVPAPPPATVAFVLGNRTLFYGLTVMSCSGRTMWTLANEQLVEPPARIIYGVAPPGFVSRVGPFALTPGCYEVIFSGPTRVRFHIGPDGRLVSEPGARRADSARPQPQPQPPPPPPRPSPARDAPELHAPRAPDVDGEAR